METLEILAAVILGVMGLAIGSFLNVVVDRLPEGRSLIRPGSHCEGCQRKLAIGDLIPVISYLRLRGRCRDCGARIPWRVVVVELVSGIILAGLFVYKGPTLEFVVIACYTYIFIAIALIDLKHQLILNKIVYPSFIAGLIIAPWFVETGNGLLANFTNAVIGGAVGFGVLLIPVLVTMGRGMGLGDVKMAALIGVATGFGEVLVALLGGIILGGLTAVLLLLSRVMKRKQAMPFGPFLSIGAIVTILWGTEILNWYLGILGMR